MKFTTNLDDLKGQEIVEIRTWCNEKIIITKGFVLILRASHDYDDCDYILTKETISSQLEVELGIKTQEQVDLEEEQERIRRKEQIEFNEKVKLAELKRKYPDD